MTDIGKTKLPLWMLLALWGSTSKWRTPDWVPTQDRAILSDAARGGWTLRRAAPRWDTIWQPCARDLARKKVILLPGWGFGMSRHERVALIRAKLAGAGLQAPDPDPLALQSAQRKCEYALSPVWLGALTRNDKKANRR
jgi:hypothetical protein